MPTEEVAPVVVEAAAMDMVAAAEEAAVVVAAEDTEAAQVELMVDPAVEAEQVEDRL